MKTKLLLFLLLSNFCFSQIKFESGYYKDNAGTVIKCLVKNEDWLKNPVFIEIKLAENDAIIKKLINEITEFGIDNASKYIKATVDIDDFVDDLKTFNTISEAINVQTTVLLKVENEGKANLYSYSKDKLIKYFFSKPNEPVKSLVFKKYINDENQILQNNAFRQTLVDNLDLNEILLKKLLKTKYELDDLNKFFQIYNSNKNTYNDLKNNQKRKVFNLSVKAGAVFNSYQVEGIYFNYSFPAQSSFSFGFELENVLNINKNKWSIYFEPFYETYTSSTTDSKNGTSIISLKFLNLGVGAKHKMFINNNSFFFINFGLQMVNNIGDKNFDSSATAFKLDQNSFNLHGGFGFKFQNKYFIEYRLRSSLNPLVNYGSITSSYSSSALVLGYTIF